MGAYLAKPITEKESEDGTFAQVQYGSSSMQGWRVNMVTPRPLCHAAAFGREPGALTPSIAQHPYRYMGVKRSPIGFGEPLMCSSSTRSPLQEDEHISKEFCPGSGMGLFAVFDGHGGKEASTFCKKHFQQQVYPTAHPPPPLSAAAPSISTSLVDTVAPSTTPSRRSLRSIFDSRSTLSHLLHPHLLRCNKSERVTPVHLDPPPAASTQLQR